MRRFFPGASSPNALSETNKFGFSSNLSNTSSKSPSRQRYRVSEGITVYAPVIGTFSEIPTFVWDYIIIVCGFSTLTLFLQRKFIYLCFRLLRCADKYLFFLFLIFIQNRLKFGKISSHLLIGSAFTD